MTVVGAEVEGKGELACRGAYGHYRPRPDIGQYEQESLYQSRDTEVENFHQLS